MQIKFQKSLSDFKYLVMFDLASKITGVCVWDLNKSKPINVQVLKTSNNCELKVEDLYHLLKNYFDFLSKVLHINLDDVLVYKEAMPAQLRGGSSTVQTFISLARSHAILDFFTYENNLAIYDYVGVYPISTHAYFRRLKNLDPKQSVDKKDLLSYVQETYHLDGLTYDESDAIFLAKTFVEFKWNKDLDEEIKVVKKHQKSLKAPHAIIACEETKNRLEGLKWTLNQTLN